MFALLPPRWRRAVKVSVSAAWGLVGLGGGAMVFIAPNPFVEKWGPVVPAILGTLLAVAAVLAILGIARDHYRWEWVASWLAGGCLAPYVFSLWWIVANGSHNRLTSAIFATALLACVIGRSMSCGAHAAKLRIEYAQTAARLDIVEEAGDGHP